MRFLFSLLLLILLNSCSTMTLRETFFGTPKRLILADRVEEFRSDSDDTKKEFVSALAAFRKVAGSPPAELESHFNTLQSDYEDCRKAADEIRTDIKDIESVAKALFREWEGELDNYKDASLKANSRQQLTDARKRVDGLLQALHNAEAAMQPVLDVFADQTLALKHTLNAAAVKALDQRSAGLSREVEALVKRMETSISEADRFLKEWQGAE